jgi:signal transduction histidine kinase
VPSARLVVRVAAGWVAATGLVVLAGWALDLPVLTRLAPGLPRMAPNTAVGLLAAGAGLWLLAGPASPGAGRLGRWLGLLVAFLGAAVLAEYASGHGLGIDRLLFGGTVAATGAMLPGRPSPHTALALLLAGLALGLLDGRWRGGVPAQALALASAAVALTALLGYLYGAASLRGISTATGMALPTGFAFLALDTGILLARPQRGLVRMFASAGPAGLLARRLLPAVLLVPPVLGVLRSLGQQVGWYDAAFGLALTTLMTIVCLLVVLALTGRALDRAEEARLRAQRQAEATIRRANQELERRVAERTATLQATNAELESFSYSVSHDLRAPLRAMNGFARLLVERHAPSLSEEGREYAELIWDNAQQMGRLIDDLLAFSRLQRQAMQPTTVSMQDLVRRVWDDLAADRAGREVDLRLGELPPCTGDPRLLERVLVNLLGNALKYTRSRPQAVIEVRAYRDGGQTVYVVGDNGIGFDMRHADKLFQVFQRLHDSDYEGTGVGLALVQRIVARHGGRVWATGEPGQGAAFHFTLEAAEADGEPAGRREEPAPSRAG